MATGGSNNNRFAYTCKMLPTLSSARLPGENPSLNPIGAGVVFLH